MTPDDTTTTTADDNNAISVNLQVVARFRAELFPANANVTKALSGDQATGEWKETYVDAQADLTERLIGVGSGYVGEVDKLLATSITWAKVDADIAAAAAKAAK